MRDRAGELGAWLDRYEAVLDRAAATEVPLGLLHNDFGGHNMLLDDDGRLVAILDWDWAMTGPREHDLWLVVDEPRASDLLAAYGIGDVEIDRTHLEYALLRRALGDLNGRIAANVDRPGVTTWGFDRLDRLDATLSLFW